SRSDLIAQNEITTFAQLRSMWEELESTRRTFVTFLSDADVTRPLSYKTSAGIPFTEPLHELMLHDVNHGTQFRQEAAVRLTQLGFSPGDLDLIVYLRQR